MTRTVLVINSGSSSVKYQLIQPDTAQQLADGIVERIGEDSSTATLMVGERRLRREGRVADHDAALRLAFELSAEAGLGLDDLDLVAVGHRVVHGGKTFYRPAVIDDAMMAKLEELAPLAPLHNPPAMVGIEVARRI